MNIRKLTPDLISAELEIPGVSVASWFDQDVVQVTSSVARRLANVLRVPEAELLQIRPDDCVIISKSDVIEATKRAVHRDGIHFYNYYSLPTPAGRVGPVILDILCPPDRHPLLNHGHLEPAITVNLGPGDIYGRWGDDLTHENWCVLAANREGDSWICGDSYVEAPYRPHTYSRADEKPARILSYTCGSRLEGLIDRSNPWSDNTFDDFVAQLKSTRSASLHLRWQMERRAYTADSLSCACGLANSKIRAFCEGDLGALNQVELRSIAKSLRCDWRLFLAPMADLDVVGKSILKLVDSRKSIREYCGHQVASLAGSASLPDLCGYYLRVDTDILSDQALGDAGSGHYYVTQGSVRFSWRDHHGRAVEHSLTEGDAVWIDAFVAHQFGGHGSLIRIGNGDTFSYIEGYELSNTFAAGATLHRARRDAVGWGYDR